MAESATQQQLPLAERMKMHRAVQLGIEADRLVEGIALKLGISPEAALGSPIDTIENELEIRRSRQ